MFCDQNPVLNIDRRGHDILVIKKYFTLPKPPTDGPRSGYIGFTDTFFDDDWHSAYVYNGTTSASGCCWKVNLKGYARIAMWYVPGAFGNPNKTPARDHEMQHVDYWDAMYREINREAASVGREHCYSRKQAECLKPVIEGLLYFTYVLKGYAKNWRFDCESGNAYNGECEKAVAAENAYKNLAARLEREIRICQWQR